MDDDVLLQLQKTVTRRNWNYHPSGPNASEPAAWACLALCAHGQADASMPLANWLAELQSSDGSVGVSAEQETPSWPTSLAMLAWLACDRALGITRFEVCRERALEWVLKTKGKTLTPRRQIGHDTMILGWSWAAATHSWLEPTCLFVLALKAMGQIEHSRTRSGVRMIVDRLHENGGCNYGNTIVLGQSTLPHVQPTGLAMLAICDEPDDDPRIDRSLDYLERVVNPDTTTASLCYALMGLSAHDRRPANAAALLDQAMARDREFASLNCYKLALLALARLDHLQWLPQAEAFPNVSAQASQLMQTSGQAT